MSFSAGSCAGRLPGARVVFANWPAHLRFALETSHEVVLLLEGLKLMMLPKTFWTDFVVHGAAVWMKPAIDCYP